MNHWLMKSEPGEFGIDDLERRPDRTEPWDGVRNYQARNMMRDQMKLGDRVFFYHSNCEQPGIVGIAEIANQPAEHRFWREASALSDVDITGAAVLAHRRDKIV